MVLSLCKLSMLPAHWPDVVVVRLIVVVHAAIVHVNVPRVVGVVGVCSRRPVVVGLHVSLSTFWSDLTPPGGQSFFGMPA